MSLTNMEIEKLKNWGQTENVPFLFPQIVSEIDSYFEDGSIKEEKAVEEYKFANIPQLKELLKNRKIVVKDESVDTMCAVAVFKNRREKRKQSGEELQKVDNNKLPDFIYNF